MPAQPYREKVVTVDALQYTGNNNAEMLAFAPGFLVENESGALKVGSSPFLLAATDWVLKHVDGAFQFLNDTTFKNQWVHGSAPSA